MAGGKYTTYRAMSAEAADLILPAESKTAATPLGGNTAESLNELIASAPALASAHALTRDEATLAIRHYGVQTPNLLALLPETAPPGLTRLECAQIAFAVNHEMAQSLADVMFVSTYWGYERKWTRENVTPVTREMARQFGWEADHMEKEISQLA